MSDDEEIRVAARYRALLETHGASHSALDWGSQAGQWLRFEILAEIGDLVGARVLDVGCGLGDFATWLEQRGLAVDYTGLDLTPELLAEAARRHPGRQFIQGSILDPVLLAGECFDYVFSSGIFCYYPEGGDGWLEVAVTRMWQLASKGLTFNSLSTWAEIQEVGEYYADPTKVLAFCHGLSPWVVLRHDYHQRDFTVYLRRESVES